MYPGFPMVGLCFVMDSTIVLYVSCLNVWVGRDSSRDGVGLGKNGELRWRGR